MRRVIFCTLLVALFSCSAFAQKNKTWTELSEKEAAKILNDSPWGQTQVEGRSDTPSSSSAITAVAASKRDSERVISSGDANRMESGQPKDDRTIRYRARFLSAKPVRGAYAKLVMLKKGDTADESLATQLQEFVNRDFGDYVVVAVTPEAADPKLVGPMMQFLNTANAEVLKEKVYLERKDGKKLMLADYRPPGPDGMGAKFVFLRTVEGQPFLTPESDNVRFFAQINERVKLSVRYKVSDMMYDGKLEY
ncbi:MAG TPA: hypothetical protein VFR78_00670 [Pyrinomonadaceae bacterium]|nr:hypothetical protein [Pyrinomonadaceae bacterium]